MRIGEVAQQAGVRVSLIRYYEDIGLLPEPERVSGQRRYDGLVLRRLAVIDVAQRVRRWLEEASSCGCERIDDCALFDDAGLLPPARGAPPLTGGPGARSAGRPADSRA